MIQRRRKFLSGSHCGAAVAVCFFLITALATAQVNYALMRTIALDRYGQDSVQVIDEWRAEIEAMKTLPEMHKLRRANAFFNDRIRWASDSQIWQEKDYWATPLEVMGQGRGDCEDFAIAKYTMLILAGVDVKKLRITYVKAKVRADSANTDGSSEATTDNTMRDTAHMVLTYYPEPAAEPMVLDNLVREIQAASVRTDLTPVYGFNSSGIWVGGASSPATTQPESKLSRWRDVLRRAAQEGLG